ncbi:serine/threonine-protein kinase-like protein [Melanomma pulvis-pyrius CBS 109.77]|uniref:Serine/threonine-protein kinase-like protein n=1 Tax=Melanomma pulvis-pyrius CBS 109.77 TaxID=1314802 RepID=A0A6A6XTL4_9PLEO|nr:serine/threonine-protein kinase-like protein [Melanomma pulvis-pyrius CBS 109.77]
MAAPQVNSVKDLHVYGESFTTRDGETKFKSTFVSFLDDDAVAYFGETPVKSSCLTPEVLRECLKPIPDEMIYPEPPTDVTEFSSPITGSLYIKRPDLKSWDDFEGTDFLLRLFLGEIETWELLRRHPHPNIVRYHGCTVNRGRITGIVLDQYPTTLEERLKASPRAFNKDLVLEGTESAVAHLHSLGLAHNDLSPVNIMLDECDRPFIIDFGSCKPFGSRLMEVGTEGWVEDHSIFSEQRHDDTALQKIRAWLEKMESEGISA